MKLLLILTSLLFLPGCMVGYILESGYHQQKILRARTPINEYLKKTDIDPQVRKKLELIQEVKTFAEKELGLKKTENYQTYVPLNKPYVTWVVRASESFKLEAYQWWFPIVGHVPYKGYFSEESALKEAKKFDPQKYDTYVRGVTAYSTLGWFEDPILSPMLRYEEQDLVELIIHETVHATIYIKSQAEFNERLATFIGQEGTKLFYKFKEGDKSPTLQLIEDGNRDTELFSEFISTELESLRKWYEQLRPEDKTDKNKLQQIGKIQERFKRDLYPQLKTDNYRGFESKKLNNAILLSYETYIQDLSDFRKFFEGQGRDFKALLKKCKELESSKDPQEQLKKWLL